MWGLPIGRGAGYMRCMRDVAFGVLYTTLFKRFLGLAHQGGEPRVLRIRVASRAETLFPSASVA